MDDYIESIENISVEDDSDQPDLQLSLTSNKEMDRFRDLIAEQMWNDYQEHIRKDWATIAPFTSTFFFCFLF